MDKRLVKRILSSFPDGYAYTDGVFYWRGAKHVLVGFSFDTSPSHVAAYKYVMPLFVPFKEHHLGYSECVATLNKRIDQKAADFIKFYTNSAELYSEQIKELDDLNCFANYLKLRIEVKLKSGYCDELKVADLRYCYACTLVLLAKNGEAELQVALIVDGYANYINGSSSAKSAVETIEDGKLNVSELFSNKLSSRSLEFLKNVDKLSEALNHAGDGARNMLIEIQEFNRDILIGN